MLDIKLIRADPDSVARNLGRRAVDFDVAAFAELDARRKRADVASQSLRAERNAASRAVGELVRSGKTPEQARQAVGETLRRIGERLDAKAAEARRLQGQLDALLLGLPNLLAEDVPEGADERCNLELGRWGTPPDFGFPPLDHVDLGARLGGIDFDSAAKLAGSRFVVLSGAVARLHRALIQFMLDVHTGQHGYREVCVPYIANADSLVGTGQLPKFEEDLFKLRHDADFYLIPTAEVPVANLLRDEIVEAEALADMRFVCHSPCFRSEAGSHGKDTRGMLRQHQFEKVELVRMARPEDSGRALEELTGHAERILQLLELPYRKLLLCAGDTGFSASKTYDLEVWLPGQGAYREISSCSDCAEFQARRMRARWRNPATGRPELLHTLNGSGLAVGRTLIAVLENHQRADGGVLIPPALREHMGGLERLEPS